MLSANKDVLDKIAAYLIEKETITGAQFMEIYNEVKGITSATQATEIILDHDTQDKEEIQSETQNEIESTDTENV